MPPHIKRGKELKNTIDDKASVVVMDDGADNEEDDFRDDLSFDVEPDDGSFAAGGNYFVSVGVNLTTLPDETGSKSGMEEDKEFMEASFAKSKRIRAAKATTALKSKLDSQETASTMSGVSMLETILILREETERKAEIRRAKADPQRRDDAATQ
ncbi:hypothetical protein PInf_021156 [Phytophthora infestans]|nr:hypothetical protein PInf_021156 [Phytophthora infestans]